MVSSGMDAWMPDSCTLGNTPIDSSSCLTFGHNSGVLFPLDVVIEASTLATILRAVMAGNPRRLVLSPFTTYTVWTAVLVLYENLPWNCPATCARIQV